MMNLSFYQVLCIVGLPSLIGAGYKVLWSKIQKNKEDTAALKAGVQALLRNELIKSYRGFMAGGGAAAVHEKENFENMYQQYHSLGANGVMDDIREKVLSMGE